MRAHLLEVASLGRVGVRQSSPRVPGVMAGELRSRLHDEVVQVRRQPQRPPHPVAGRARRLVDHPERREDDGIEEPQRPPHAGKLLHDLHLRADRRRQPLPGGDDVEVPHAGGDDRERRPEQRHAPANGRRLELRHRRVGLVNSPHVVAHRLTHVLGTGPVAHRRIIDTAFRSRGKRSC
jgi:hypothetical protein